MISYKALPTPAGVGGCIHVQIIGCTRLRDPKTFVVVEAPTSSALLWQEPSVNRARATRIYLWIGNQPSVNS